MKKWNKVLNKWYHPNDGEVSSDDIIELSDSEYSDLMEEYNLGFKEFYVDDTNNLSVRDMVLPASSEVYESIESDMEARQQLQRTDWKVIRELERLYLADTDLHAEREALRTSITHSKLYED